MFRAILAILLIVCSASAHAECYRTKRVNHYFDANHKQTSNIDYPILCESNGFIYTFDGNFYIRHENDLYSSAEQDSLRTLNIDRTTNYIQFTENQYKFSKIPIRIHIGFIKLPKELQ